MLKVWFVEGIHFNVCKAHFKCLDVMFIKFIMFQVIHILMSKSMGSSDSLNMYRIIQCIFKYVFMFH